MHVAKLFGNGLQAQGVILGFIAIGALFGVFVQMVATLLNSGH